jgi:hypothetical protein
MKVTITYFRTTDKIFNLNPAVEDAAREDNVKA